MPVLDDLRKCFEPAGVIVFNSLSGDTNALLEEEERNHKILIDFKGFEEWFIVKFEPLPNAPKRTKECLSIWSHFLSCNHDIQCRLDYVIFAIVKNKFICLLCELKSGNKVKMKDFKPKVISTKCFVDFSIALVKGHLNKNFDSPQFKNLLFSPAKITTKRPHNQCNQDQIQYKHFSASSQKKTNYIFKALL